MARALLLLPTTTYRAGAFLDAAERLGIDIVVGSERRQALAETMGDRFLFLPLNRPSEAADTVVRYAQRHHLDAVLAVDDQGSLTAAIACERLGLRHSSPAAVAATRDKSAMRELLVRSGVPQPRYRLAGGAFPAPAVAAHEIGFPVVLKPRTLSGSRGVIRADDTDGVEATYERIRKILTAAGELDTSTILVEELVTGDEVAVEGLVRAGALEVLALFDKPEQGDGPYFEETIYVTPSRLAPEVQAALAGVTSRAVAALGITEGPVHAELRVPAGRPEPVVIEVAARTIGGRCSKALAFASGATLEELVLAQALGLASSSAPAADGAAGVLMLPIPASGVLEEVTGVAAAEAIEGIVGVELTAHPGAAIEQVPEGDRYLGFVFATGSSPAEAEAALRAAHAAITVRISPVA